MMEDESILHGDEPETETPNLYAQEDRAWRELLRALTAHFTHVCGEGEPCDTYYPVVDALNKAQQIGIDIDDLEESE